MRSKEFDGMLLTRRPPAMMTVIATTALMAATPRASAMAWNPTCMFCNTQMSTFPATMVTIQAEECDLSIMTPTSAGTEEVLFSRSFHR